MQLINGDCAGVLKTFDDSSVDAIVTDPPAGIGFMGKEWDRDKGGRDKWIEWMAGIAAECLRVLKPGGHALVWALPRTSHWTATAWEDAGFETRDRIAHCFGSGFPKSLSIGKKVDEILGNGREELRDRTGAMNNAENSQAQSFMKGDVGFKTHFTETKGHSEWEGWGTALKPAIEDWWLFRKPISEKSIAENVLKHGTGGLNIDGCRIGTEERENPACSAKGHTTAMKWGSKGVEPTTAQGRFPANLIHDGSDEVLACFPETGAEKRIKITARKGKGTKGIYGDYGEKLHDTPSYPDSGNASRFFYCAKPSKAEREGGCGGLSKKFRAGLSGANRETETPLDDVSERFRTSPARNNHPTVKAQKLMTYLCRLITPPGGTILDPFMGSGSTGKAAVAEGFDFIGIEKDPEYFEIAKARIEHEKNRMKQMELF